nr:site-specific integrase [Limnobaculum xujianqingii]
MQSYLFPEIGKHNLPDLKTKDLLEVVEKAVEKGYLDVASRLQQYLTAIMRYAVQIDIIQSNPARDLAGAFPTNKAQHRAALPLEKIPDLLQRVDSFKGRNLTKLAIKLTLLIFIRSSELRFARWSEIDFEKKLWTIPAKRKPIEGVKYSHRGTKMHDTSHLIPLSAQAISILKEIKTISGEYEFIFIGAHSPKKPMSENTINKALRTMGYNTQTEVCGHGFRTMACSTLLESELWDSEAIELQMSHKERNSVKAAYPVCRKTLSFRAGI